jgi:hypothetical protein
MALLIHATITVDGDPAQLAACAARLRLLLAAEPPDGSLEERHREDALCYDLKVRGGIPFPAFAQASQEFPALAMHAEWVSAGAGRRGRARIVAGRLADHAEEPLPQTGADGPPCYVRFAGGRLRLAFACQPLAEGAWAGYALDHARDALFRAERAGGAVVLRATEGAPEWSLAWRGETGGAFEPLALPAQPIEDALYTSLEALAQGFAADWIWFARGRREETAIEAERYARYGYPVSEANLRSARLHRLRQQAADADGPLEGGSLAAEHAWVRDALERCWLQAAEGERPPAPS